jgi:aminopeptidase N
MRRLSLAFCLAPLLISNAFALPVRPPKEYALINVEWHVNLDFDHAGLTGDVINTIKPFKSGATSFRFDCGQMDVQSVTIDGRNANFTHEKNVLMVTAPDNSEAKVYKVEIKYNDAHPTAGAYFIRAENAYPAHTPVAYTQGEMEDNRYWLPTYDFPDNKATTEGFITVPKGYKVLSNGRLVSHNDSGDTTTWHWKQELPMSTYLISFVAGPYDVGYDHWGKMDVAYWAPEGLLPWGKAAFGGTDKIIDFYSKITGFKYPWAKFAQAAVPQFMFGGMENVSAVTQTITDIYPPTAEPIQDATGLVAHELAHQWFGDTVTCADWSHAWLNEGFATFMPIWWDRAKVGEDAFDLGRYGAYQGGIGAHMGQHRSVVSTDYSDPIDNFGGFIYAGGASRLFMLVDKLGEKTFFKGVHDYLETYKFQPVTTDDFFKAMSKSSGVDLSKFEKQWLYTPAVPHLTVTESNGKLVIDQTTPTFDLDPWIWVLRGDKWSKTRVHLENAHTEFDLGDLNGAAVLVDPAGLEMITVNSRALTTTPAQNLTIYKTAPAVTRQKFLGQLSGATQADILGLIQNEKSMQLKLRLIGLLSRDSKGPLFEMAHDADARIRQSAMRRLNTFNNDGKDDAITELIETAMKEDPNDMIRNMAFGILVNRDSTGQLAEIGWKTDSFQEAWRSDAFRWYEDHDKAKAKTLALMALDIPMSETLQVEALRYLGGIGDVKGETVVYDHLVKALQTGPYAAQGAAMNGLVSYGNKDAAKYILPFTKSDLIFTRREAQGAYDQLMNGD